MNCAEVQALIEAGIPGATVKVRDLTGTGDHFSAEIEASSFAGKTVLEQHRLVYAILGEAMQGPIHALQLHTRAR